MSFSIIMSLLAGLGLFLYGMKMMGENLEKAAGDNLKKLLEVLTQNRFMGVLVGTLFTAIIQSSSATTVMVVGFVNAGLMNLYQAAGVIMGANIGTTVTGQLIALKLNQVAPIFLFVGVAMLLFMKKDKIKRIGGVLAGFGVLFLGMDIMSSAMEPLRTMPEFTNVMSSFSNPLLAMLVGVGVTVLIQSSSATVGLIQTMAMSGMVSLDTALYLIMGSSIGTCVTAMLAIIGTSHAAKRSAVIHLLLNVLGMGVVLILMQCLPVVDWIRAIPVGEGDITHQIANANTLFKLFEVVLFFPLTGMLVKMSEILVPGEDPKAAEKRLMYIDNRILQTPPIAVAQIKKEVERMGRLAVDNLSRAMESFFDGNMEKMSAVEQNEEVVNYLNHEITRYLILVGQMQLPAEDAQLLASFYHVVNDFERISDHAENMAEYAHMRYEQEIPFSEQGNAELKGILDKTIALCDCALEALHDRDKNVLPRVLVMEESVDDMEESLQQAHVDRLAQGICTPKSGMIFSDMLSNLERVADHATNIAFSIKDDNLEGSTFL